MHVRDKPLEVVCSSSDRARRFKQITLESVAGLDRFLEEALRPLGDPLIRVLVALVLVLATFSDAVLGIDGSSHGKRPDTIFVATALVRLFGLLLLQIAILRKITASERGICRLDGAFWLHALAVPLGVALSVSLQKGIGGGDHSFGASLLIQAIVIAITAPLAPWIVAIAVEKPLAWRPSPWFRRWSRWLLPLVFWQAALAPLNGVHSSMNIMALRGSAGWFWPLVLLDGALSALLFIVAEALNAAAYRRIAAS